jgi:pilus assembly protein CpaB
MKTKSLLLLVVAGGCGLVAAIAAAQHLAGNQPIVPVAPAEEHKAVVVATADIDAGTTLKADMLRVAQLPTKDLPEGTFTAVAELTGQPLRYPVFKGEPVLTGKLGRGLQFLANELPQGMKACTVKITDEENSMKGLIKPGNHVDAFWLPMKPDLTTSSVQLLLQNVKVLAVGERIEGDDIETQQRGNPSANEMNFTLLVTSAQNKRVIAAAAKGGKFRLVLRRKGDDSLEELDEVSLDRKLGLAKDPADDLSTEEVEQEPAPETWEVDIIRGAEQTTEFVNLSEVQRSSSKK